MHGDGSLLLKLLQEVVFILPHSFVESIKQHNRCFTIEWGDISSTLHASVLCFALYIV